MTLPAAVRNFLLFTIVVILRHFGYEANLEPLFFFDLQPENRYSEIGLGVVIVGRKTILERKKYNGKIIETGVEIFS